MMAPASSPNYTGLRYHVQLFSGYGDSLVDYNRKRNVLSVGLEPGRLVAAAPRHPWPAQDGVPADIQKRAPAAKLGR